MTKETSTASVLIWQPIETSPEFVPILIWVPEVNRGRDSAEVVIRVENSWWTNGGPNAGADLDFEKPPTHWMPLPKPPS